SPPTALTAIPRRWPSSSAPATLTQGPDRQVGQATAQVMTRPDRPTVLSRSSGLAFATRCDNLQTMPQAPKYPDDQQGDEGPGPVPSVPRSAIQPDRWCRASANCARTEGPSVPSLSVLVQPGLLSWGLTWTGQIG